MTGREIAKKLRLHDSYGQECVLRGVEITIAAHALESAPGQAENELCNYCDAGHACPHHRAAPGQAGEWQRPQISDDKCDQVIFEYGHTLMVLAVSKRCAEEIVAVLRTDAERSAAQYKLPHEMVRLFDWHFVGGRAVFKSMTQGEYLSHTNKASEPAGEHSPLRSQLESHLAMPPEERPELVVDVAAPGGERSERDLDSHPPENLTELIQSFEEWLDCTGAISRGHSWYWELRSFFDEDVKRLLEKKTAAPAISEALQRIYELSAGGPPGGSLERIAEIATGVLSSWSIPAAPNETVEELHRSLAELHGILERVAVQETDLLSNDEFQAWMRAGELLNRTRQ